MKTRKEHNRNERLQSLEPGTPQAWEHPNGSTGSRPLAHLWALHWRSLWLLVMILTLAAPMLAGAQDYTYTIENGEATITQYTGPGGNVVIPGTLGGSPVTRIGDEAFATIGLGFPTSVTIPNSVVSIGVRAFADGWELNTITFGNGLISIGDGAFENCFQLTSISIPASVTTIGDHAFSSTGLTSVSIPANITSMGSGAFQYCQSLAAFSVDPGNSAFSSVSGVLFNESQTILLQYPPNKTDSAYDVPGTVTTIRGGAFAWCSSLITITLSDGVTSIGDEAFSSCSSLTSITLPDSVTSIGANAFFDCSSLTSVTLPNSVTSIGELVFAHCSSLTNVIIPDSVTAIGNYAFYNCSSLTSITLPDSMTSIGIEAFFNCSSLTSITLPNSVTSIEQSVFSGCSSLTSISLPNSVTAIGQSAFSGCSSLTTITLPDSVTSIGERAFLHCSSLTTITIPDSVTSIADGAFADCSSLTTINLPDGVTSIGNGAFYSCSSLSSITLPDSVTSIGIEAFANGSSLNRIYFAGDAPDTTSTTFDSTPATLYYLPGATGWTATLAGRPAVLWNPHIVTDDGVLGVQAGKLGFTLMGAVDVPVVVEACSDLANPDWTTVTNLVCGADGKVQFTDPEAVNPPVRFYRFRPE